MRKLLPGGIFVFAVLVATLAFVVADSPNDPVNFGSAFPPGYHPSEEELEALEDARYHAEYPSISPIPPPPPAASTPDPPPSPGIYDDPPIPDPAYKLINGWERRIGQQDVGAYAGSLTVNEQQGLVLVVIENLGGHDVQFHAYHTPQQVGPVRIISATKEGVLTLRAQGGERLMFDVISGRYL